MGLHKKKLRAEKAKVKLKGSILPKGLNVTKTDFKVKKIVIREQLREVQESDLLSSKNLNVKVSSLFHRKTRNLTNLL